MLCECCEYSVLPDKLRLKLCFYTSSNSACKHCSETVCVMRIYANYVCVCVLCVSCIHVSAVFLCVCVVCVMHTYKCSVRVCVLCVSCIHVSAVFLCVCCVCHAYM